MYAICLHAYVGVFAYGAWLQLQVVTVSTIDVAGRVGAGKLRAGWEEMNVQNVHVCVRVGVMYYLIIVVVHLVINRILA